MSSFTSPQAEYAYGAGHVNALNPGLVYEAGPTDYNNFLCAHGLTTPMLQLITGDDSECSTTPGSVHDLNYPSFSLATRTPTAIPLTTYRRTLTNVRFFGSTYLATVTASVGLNIQVTPDTLTFDSRGVSRSNILTISGCINETLRTGFATLTWDDDVHQVRSPIFGHIYNKILRCKNVSDVNCIVSCLSAC